MLHLRRTIQCLLLVATVLLLAGSGLPMAGPSYADRPPGVEDDLHVDVELHFSEIATNGPMQIHSGWATCDGVLYFIDDYKVLYAWDGNRVVKVSEFEYADSLVALGDRVYFLGDPRGDDLNYVHLVSVEHSGGQFYLRVAAESYVRTTTQGVTRWRFFKRDSHLVVYDGAVYAFYESGDTVSPTHDWQGIGRYSPDAGFQPVWQRGDVNSGDLLGVAGGRLYFKMAVFEDGGLWRLYAYKTGDTVHPVGTERFHSLSNLVDVGGKAYFRGWNGSYGIEIWRSDGVHTDVIDLAPGGSSSDPGELVSVDNKLFFYLRSDNPRKLYTAYLNQDGEITAETIKVVKEVNCRWLDVAHNTLFFNGWGKDKGFFRSDGTGYGTVKLSDRNLSGVGILNGRLLVNDLDSSTAALLSTQATPTNVRWVGLRASYYGIQDEDANPPFGGDPGSKIPPDYDFPHPGQWEAAAKATSSYFFGSEAQPTLVWIVTRPRVDLGNEVHGGTIVQMDKPDGVTFDDRIYFNDDIETGEITGTISVRDYHEAYLDYFDAAGIKVYIQVEPGWAPLDDNGSTKGLLTAVMDYLIREDQNPNNEIHESVIGIGIDVEWYNNCKEGESEKGHLNGEEDKVARWYNLIHNPRNSNRHLDMFLKHWHTQFMPSYSVLKNYLSTEDLAHIMFINDSQGEIFYSPDEFLTGSNPSKAADALDWLLTEFADWANAYPDSPVGFQIAYPNDWDSPNKTSCGWGHFLDSDQNGEQWGDGGPDLPGQNAIPQDEAWKLIPKLGYSIAEKIQASNNRIKDVALFYVDFRARMLYGHTVKDSDWPNQDGPGIFEWHDYTYPAWISSSSVLSQTVGHTKYYVNDLVTHKGKTWRCQVNHQPSPSAEPGSSSYWVEVRGGVEPWQAGVFYDAGDLVTYNGELWKCVYAHTSQVDWAPGAPGIWFWEKQ